MTINFQKVIATTLLITMSAFMLYWNTPTARAAEVEIDASVDGTDNSWNHTSPTHIWTSDTTGYVFWLENNAGVRVSSTTDSGATWSSGQTVTSQTDTLRLAIWYDKWTPGDTGDLVHIATIDSGADNSYYTQYSLATNAVTVSEIVTGTHSATLSAGANDLSITKGTNNQLYLAAADASDAWVDHCDLDAVACSSTGHWSETADLWGSGDGNDGVSLFPIDNDDIMLVSYDTSAEDVEYNTWDDSAGSWAGFTGIDTAVPDDTTYDFAKQGGTIGTSTGEVYYAYCDDCGGVSTGNTHDIEVVWWDGSSWNNKTNVRTNSTGPIQQLSMTITTGGTLFVAWAERSVVGTANSANLYWASSTDAGATWSSPAGPLNSTTDTLHGVNLNGINADRVSVTWKYITSPNADDLMHETLMGGLGTPATNPYDEDGYWISEAWDVGAISNVYDSFIEFSSTTPSDTRVTVKTAVNSSAVTPPAEGSFATSTSGGSIAGVSASDDLTGKYVWVRVELFGSSDGQSTPTFSLLTMGINDVGTPPEPPAPDPTKRIRAYIIN